MRGWDCSRARQLPAAEAAAVAEGATMVLPNLILAGNHNSDFVGGRDCLRSKRGLPDSGLSPWTGMVIFETFLTYFG